MINADMTVCTDHEQSICGAVIDAIHTQSYTFNVTFQSGHTPWLMGFDHSAWSTIPLSQMPPIFYVMKNAYPPPNISFENRKACNMHLTLVSISPEPSLFYA